MDRLEGKDAKAHREIEDCISYLYPSFNTALRNYPNIEDFLNLLEMAAEFNTESYISSSLWGPGRLTNVRQEVLRAVTSYLWDRTSDWNLQPLRQFLGSCVVAGDTIVTFNWDITLEQALEKEGKFNFWYEPQSELILLKPHGSIDWFLRSQVPKDLIKKAVRKIDGELCVYPEFNFAKYQKMGKVSPLIVPPVARKDFSLPFLMATWQRVYRAISRASRLYIMGYSLPKEDQFARFVLGRALRNNALKAERGKKKELLMTVVNPDEAVHVTFARLLGQGSAKFRFHQTTFDRFVTSVEEEELDFP